MTREEFKRNLLNYRDSFKYLVNFNLQSPVEVQSLINQIIAFLKSVKCEKNLKLKIEESIVYLQIADAHSKDFSKGLRTDFSTTNDLAAIHLDGNENSWSQQVIGTSEAAIDNIVRFLDKNA